MNAPHRILIVGQGGREHALAWRLARDPLVAEVCVAPGNEGIARTFRTLPLASSDPAAVLAACRQARATLVVIGPEAPLAAGLADALRTVGVPTFGPGAAAARLESSKWFAKEVMAEAGVPTARAEVFSGVREAIAALARFGPPWVVKQDGLAAGKGVTVTEAREAAEAAVREALAGGSGAVVLEQFLAGEEASLMAVCDGTHFLMLPPARDFKRALDGDRGPNTGGMGAFAPSTQVSAALEAEVGERVVRPVLQCLLARGTPFTGTLYVGLMLGESGPRVVEFNARFGDPEAEVVLPLLEGSPATLLASAARGALQAGAVQRGSGAAVGVVIAAEGYPEAPKAGGRIVGLERLMERDDLLVFHAGTAWNDGWRVHGGRAVHVVACGATPAEARARVYEGIATLGGEGWRCRGDIAAAAAGADAHLRPAGAR